MEKLTEQKCVACENMIQPSEPMRVFVFPGSDEPIFAHANKVCDVAVDNCLKIIEERF